MSTFSSIRAQRSTNPNETDELDGAPSSQGGVGRNLTGVLPSTGNSANPTFAVLKSTFFQQSFGHPLIYAKTLMQIGFEPIGPTPGRTIFGKNALFYPNAFRYLKFIYHRDGFLGLYRGFGCSLASKMICWYTTTKIDAILDPVDPDDKTKPTWNTCIKKTLREVRCQSFGILLSQPFHVMAVRAMSQFIGRETNYSSWNFLENFHEILRNDGIAGFFAGLIPRWLLETATIVLSNVLIHLLKSQLPKQDDMIPLYEYMAALFAQTATYPLSVVSTITAINRSGLDAETTVFANWHDAYRYLEKTDQLKRGSSLFNRVAPNPELVPIRKT